MTMLDDDRLAALLAQAGAAFEVPASGPEDIVARAAGRASEDADGDDGMAGDVDAAGDVVAGPDGRVHRAVALAGRHRVLSVAACVAAALVLAGAVGALVRGPSQPTLTSGLPKTGVHAPAIAPTTTTTPGRAAGGATNGSSQFKTAAPSGTGAAPNVPAPGPNPTAPTLPSDAVGQSAKIEQTGSLSLTVGRGKLDKTVTLLTNLAGAYGGFVATSQSQSGGSNPSGNVTLEVPVDNFTTVLHRAQALGKTSDLTTKATDVTGQYVDLQARITALQASRQQYLTILSKATTVGDILSVQEQLDTLQQQIEQLQGQLQLLTSQTSYSAVNISVSETAPAPRPSPLPESGLVRAWHASIGGFVAGVEGVIRVAGPLLFALLLLGVVLAGGRALWRRYQRHNL